VVLPVLFETLGDVGDERVVCQGGLRNEKVISTGSQISSTTIPLPFHQWSNGKREEDEPGLGSARREATERRTLTIELSMKRVSWS
jgi:hypothetical protein